MSRDIIFPIVATALPKLVLAIANPPLFLSF